MHCADILRCFGETHCYGIHAIAQAGWRRAVIEYVAEVGFAAAAGNFCAGDAEAAIDFFDEIFFGDGLIETRPAGTGIEFGGGVEKSGVTADAAENSLGMIVGILIGVGALGAFVARDFVGVGRKLLAPFGVCLDDGRDGDFFYTGAGA